MKQMLSVIALLIVLAALGGLAFLAYKHASAELFPLVTGAIGFFVSKAIESWKETRMRLYEKKREAYTKLLAPWREIVVSSMVSKKEVNWSASQVQKAVEAAFDTVLYASDDVVRAYGNFLSLGAEQDKTADDVGKRLSALLKAMRKDLGNKYTTLDDVEVMAMFKAIGWKERKRLKEQSQSKMT